MVCRRGLKPPAFKADIILKGYTASEPTEGEIAH